jgi:protein kinase-like protein/PEGA domain-containing protein
MKEPSSSDDSLLRAFERALSEAPDDPFAAMAAVLGAAGTDRNDDTLNLQGRRAGEYTLVRILGAGGMGVTYEARGPEGQIVAIKVVGKVKAGSLARFASECDALQHLDRPDVVRYLGRGRLEGGEAYMVMEFIEGCDLGRLVDDLDNPGAHPLAASLREECSDPIALRNSLIGVVAKVARALEGVHREGIVHRDVKPANIMVMPNLQPILIDFGLSRDAFREGQLTRTAAVLGTLRFMAPEQRRSASDTDRRADVYSLGVVLGLVVGGIDLLQDSHDPSRPWRLPDFIAAAEARKVPDPLRAILNQALQHRREDRYTSAGEFADDLDRFLAGRPVRARLPGRAAQLWNHPWTRVVVAVFLTAAIAAGIIASILREPYLVTIDTLNDGETVYIDGVNAGVAPVVDYEIAPGTHEIVYRTTWSPPLYRRITIDRHHNRVNLLTLGRIDEGEEEANWGSLSIECGDAEAEIRIDGKVVSNAHHRHRVTPGWHRVEALTASAQEEIEVQVLRQEIASVVLLSDRTRHEAADYRYTLGDLSQRLRPRPSIDLDDGVVVWMNDFADKGTEIEGCLHLRTTVTPIVPGKSLSMRLRHEFPRPLRNLRVVWNQNTTGAQARIATEYRFGDTSWRRAEFRPGDPTEVRSRDEEHPEGIRVFELRSTMRLEQRPAGFSTVEMLWGYFDPHPSRGRDPALTILGDDLE